MKPIKFYNPGGEPIKTDKYKYRLIKTKHGLRKFAVAKVNGKTYWKLVPC